MSKENTILLISLIGVVAILFFAPLVTQWFGYSLPEEGADLGQLYGSVAALFSGLAFVGVIAAIHLQRQELVQTREELRGQKDQLQAQSKTLQKQNFENTFFQLVGLHNDIVGALAVKGHVGRACFGVLVEEFDDCYRELSTATTTNQATIINVAYLKFHNRFQHQTGHYFRNLYNIVKFVKNSDIENKQFYVNLLRAQLSSHELTLMFYNCLSELGITKFKLLVEEFALLENMNQTKVSREHLSLYRDGAFREQQSS